MRQRLICILFCIVLVTSALSGCGSKKTSASSDIDFTVAMNENEEPYEFSDTDTYTNYIKMDKSWGEMSSADNSAAIGDPFVLRYDGKYYLYPSTAGNYEKDRGVRVFESEDLINWTYKGFAAEGKESSWGWAPEVVYHNGTFYMIVSPSGDGHWVLSSDSPLGPFKPVNYIGCNFDGSFYVGDDGSLYVIYAENSESPFVKLDMETMTITQEKGKIASYLGKWVEGQHLFRRNDILYCTYTGNDVRSESYRVGYSYLLGDDIFGDFVIPTENVVLLNASGEGYYGLGHSMNVVGPNLDSYYTSYHTIFEFRSPFHREMMVDQMVTNGGQLLANGPTYTEVVMPERPDFETRGVESGFVSEEKTEEIYTIEYNATPKTNSTTDYLFAYEDAKNYVTVRWNLSKETLSLVKVENGKEKELQSAAVKGMLADKLHTIRVEKGADEIRVFLDTMKKLTVSAEAIDEGKIGVKGEATYSYIAFTNDACGSSDFDSVKNIPSSFPAVHYLRGENRGYSIQNAKDVENGIRQEEPENTRKNEFDGSYALVLDTANDWVKYAINAAEESYYGLSGNITAASAGAKIQLIVDESEVYTFTVPEVGTDAEEYVNVMLGEIPLKQGNHTLKIRLCSGTFEVHTFTMKPTNPSKLEYETALDTMDGIGWNYRGDWEVEDGALVGFGLKQPAYAFVGDATMTDFSLEVDLALLEEMTMYEAGILFRADEVCSYRINDMAESLQGYYLAFRNDQITLYRYNYASETLDFAKVEMAKDEYHKVKIEMKNNHILVYVDDLKTPLIDYYDAKGFLSGQIGLASYGAQIGYKNLKIKTY